MKNTLRVRTEISIAVLISMLLMLTACGSDDKGLSPVAESMPSPATDSSTEPAKKVVITIGNFTDMTGPSANALRLIDMALEDMVQYYNDGDLIPGVRLEVVAYDGQLDPSKDLPGYEWLKERGADLIFTSVTSTATTLKPVADSDQMVIFTMTPDITALSPPGYVFCSANTLGDYQSYTLLKWIAENDPDFPKDRPARVGCAFWAETYSRTYLEGMEKYCKIHPEQYEWEGGYLNNFSFTWRPEVDALKNCDYVMPPGPMQQFVKEYREAGHTAKFIGTDFQIAMYRMIDALDLWDEADGMLLLRAGPWWNDDDKFINLAKQLLHEYHPEDVDVVMREGPGYQAVRGIYIVLEIIKDAIETVGAAHFNSEALYDAAQSFTLPLYGIDDFQNFTETKRTSLNYFGMYRLYGAEKDIFRIDHEWIPVVYEP